MAVSYPNARSTNDAFLVFPAWYDSVILRDVKTAVSIPDELFERADTLAKRAGKTRSEFYADALREHVRRQVDHDVTARLDEVYGDGDVGADERDWLIHVSRNLARRARW